MDLQGVNTSGTSGASLELASLKMAKDLQQQEGQATLQLLESAASTAGVPPSTSANPAVGANINTFA